MYDAESLRSMCTAVHYHYYAEADIHYYVLESDLPLGPPEALGAASVTTLASAF